MDEIQMDRTVLIADIILDSGCQIRDGLNQVLVKEYSGQLEVSEPPPIDLFSPNGKPAYLVPDGCHRIAAALDKGRTCIQANIFRGDLEDAIRHGFKKTSLMD